MKQILVVLFSFFTISSFCQRIDTLSIQSTWLNETRKIVVYTPWQYEYMKNLRFNVLYVFDAQAREYFDMVTATMAFQNNNICPMIVVGIISNDRNKDFLPKNNLAKTSEQYNGHLGNAGNFLSFISREVIPQVDSSYRTLPKRGAIGHSNGGTFISYCFLQQPELFDAYIAISPNFGYDSMQLPGRFQKFDPGKLNTAKFFYMCNSAGDPEIGDWITGRNIVKAILGNDDFKKHLFLKTDDFSSTETHGTVFQIGVLTGLKEYFKYQYFNAKRFIAYYQELFRKKQFDLTPDYLNRIGYNFYYLGETTDALEILLWANKLFPEDINLFDSIGDMYQNLNDKDDAKKYYLLLDQNIEKQKATLKADDYKQLKDGAQSRLNSLGDKK